MLRGCGLIEELSGFVCLASLVVVGIRGAKLRFNVLQLMEHS